MAFIQYCIYWKTKTRFLLVRFCVYSAALLYGFVFAFSTFRHCLHGTQVNRPIGHHTDVKMHEKLIELEVIESERQKESGPKASNQPAQANSSTTTVTYSLFKWYVLFAYCIHNSSITWYGLCISISLVCYVAQVATNSNVHSVHLYVCSLPFSVTMTFAGWCIVCHTANML